MDFYGLLKILNKIFKIIQKSCLQSRTCELVSSSLRGSECHQKILGDLTVPAGKEEPCLRCRKPT